MQLVKSNPLLSSRSGLLQHFNDTLALLSPIAGTEFASTNWQFNYQTSITTSDVILDFSLFDCNHLKFVEVMDLEFDGNVYQINSVELAKILFLTQASAMSASGYVREFNTLARLFSFLNEQGSNCVETNDYQALFQYLMTMDVSASGVKARFSSLSYNSAFAVNINKLNSTLHLYGIKGVLSNTSETYIKKAQKSAVEAVTGLTLADYMEGGSFNFLTLSVGRHYIDHCGTYFEQHYPLAMAFQSCLRDVSEIIQQEFEQQIGSRYNVEKFIQKHINAVLTGRNILTDPFLIKSGRQKGSFIIQKDRCELIQSITQSFFWEQYQQACDQTVLLSKQALTLISKQLKLPERFDTFEFLRAMLLTQLTNIALPKGPEAILRQYCATLKDKRNITPMQFFDVCAAVKKKLNKKVPRNKQGLAQLLAQADIPFASGGFAIREFVGNVEAAGNTSMLALTGWRASEYGFPLSAIKVTDNQDILDSTYSPFRFMLNWVVPKTNGKTKLDREITLSTYLLASQLNSLFAESANAPCLYSKMKRDTHDNDSSGIHSSRVLRMWSHFVHHYMPFRELRQLEHLKEKEVLSEGERIDFIQLSQKYPDNAYTADFRHTLKKVTNELPLLLATGQLARNINDRPSNKLFGFIKGILTADEMNIWQKYLDPLLQQKLKELSIEKPKDLGRDLVKTCTASVLDNCVYPTPHGFRHIWAEAVLRRYSGDVGWFIRSHFKHLDELDEVAEQFTASEVIDLKPNAWSNCIVRRTTMKQASCAIDGEPQGQNADPSLCLGCINSDIEDGHVVGILLQVENHVKILKNIDLPETFKSKSKSTVINARKQFLQLKRNSGSSKYDDHIKYFDDALVSGG